MRTCFRRVDPRLVRHHINERRVQPANHLGAPWVGCVSAYSQQSWEDRAGGNVDSCASEESTDDSYLPSPRHTEQWKNLKKLKNWKKWEEGLLRRARKAFKTCVEEYDDEERMAWYEWKMRNEDCLKLNEEWAVHRMLCLLKQTIEPVPKRLQEASRAAKKRAEEAHGALQLRCENVNLQLKSAILSFAKGDHLHETVKHKGIEELVEVIVLVQGLVDDCQKQGSQFLIEITERNQGPLHEALKALRDVFTLRLSLTVELGNSTAWEDAVKKAYRHYPGVLDDAEDEERSKISQSYGKVFSNPENFCKLGFMAFDTNATKKAKGKKRPKKRPKSGSEPPAGAVRGALGGLT